MKPVFQTRFGQDPDGPGNCFSACVASLLECSLDDLPDEATIVAKLKQEFAGDWDKWPDRFKWGKSWQRLWMATQEECRKRGLAMLEVRGGFDEMPDCWCIISGESPRGLMHSCVGYGMKIIHDPHPDGGGVSEKDRTYLFFVAINPAVDHCCPECPVDG